MAKKAAGNDNGTPEKIKTEWRGFVNYSYTKSDVNPFQAWYDDADNFQSELATALEQGYKLTVKYDSGANCFMAGLFCENPALPNVGLLLTQRSSDWYKAIAKALYCHTHVFKAVWPTNVKRFDDPIG